VCAAGSDGLDPYTAISNPLLYAVNMSSRVCTLLMTRVYLVGIADALIHKTLPFCFVSLGLMRSIISSVIYLHSTSFPVLT
jgi:hypothetical protein